MPDTRDIYRLIETIYREQTSKPNDKTGSFPPAQQER